ncbi:hypothetical protein LX36DRAFT_531044, partial [Colletotrichum falcatum]
METSKMMSPPLSEASDDHGPKTGPKVSPYSSTSCRVYFRSGKPFRVPRDLLCDEFKNMRRGSGEVRLKNVPDEVGHVIVHYLYTRTWQTLEGADPPEDAAGPPPPDRLEVGMHVYAAAQTYGMPGLAELARQDISRRAAPLPALQVLLTASDVCRLLGDGDAWFSAFVGDRVERLLRDDADPLDRARFLTCFDSATPYSKMLAGLMLDMCCRESASPPPEPRPTPQPE